MVAAKIDPVKYKAEQRREWGAVAPGLRRWWSMVERGAQAISDHMILRAEVQTGHKVLDIATGYGEPALTAAQRVGPSGRVIGIDLAPELLEIARDRAAAHGFKHVSFYEMDAEDISLPEDSFDVALCRLGLPYFPNPLTALESVRRHLKVGGRFVAATWCSPEESPVEGLPDEIGAKSAHISLLERSIPGPFNLSDSKTLEEKFTQAGFSEVSSEKLSVAFEFTSVDDFLLHTQETNITTRAITARLSPERQEAVWDQVRKQTARRFQTPSGKVIIPAEVVCIVSRR